MSDLEFPVGWGSEQGNIYPTERKLICDDYEHPSERAAIALEKIVQILSRIVESPPLREKDTA